MANEGLRFILEDRRNRVFIIEDRGGLDAFKKEITAAATKEIEKREAEDRAGRSRLKDLVLD